MLAFGGGANPRGGDEGLIAAQATVAKLLLSPSGKLRSFTAQATHHRCTRRDDGAPDWPTPRSVLEGIDAQTMLIPAAQSYADSAKNAQLAAKASSRAKPFQKRGIAIQGFSPRSIAAQQLQELNIPYRKVRADLTHRNWRRR